jgi:hypothetical protein
LVSQEGIILGEDEAVLLQNPLYTLLCICVFFFLKASHLGTAVVSVHICVCINLIMRVPGVLGLCLVYWVYDLC